MITVTIGKKVEQEYRSLFSRECPRPVKVRNVNEGETLFVTCLLEKWQPLIQAVLKELLVDPPKLNQLIKGRTGSRSFDQEKADTLLLTIETAVKKHLRKTEEGVQFYREGKNTAVKSLTFCILGCQLIRMAKEKWNLSNIKTKLINKTLVHYYLEGATKISNAEMNDFEQFIVAREKKKEEKPKLVVREKLVLEEKEKVSECKPVIESPLLLPRDKLATLTLFTVEEHFLEGDQEMTDAFQKICEDKVENKRCITCDESHEFYSVAARKLIHLFIYKTDLFQNIDFRANCLLEEQIDVTELRRKVELLLRQEVGQWELKPEEKNKFVLCTVCHIIRHVHLLKQLDSVDAINTLFKFRGEIYGMTNVDLNLEREQVMKDLQLNSPQVIGKVQPKEVVISQLPKQEKKPDKTDKFSTALDLESIDDEKIELFYELIEQCDSCSFSQSECKNRKSEIREMIFSRPKYFREYWFNNPSFQTCIAKVLVEKYENGEI